MDTELTYLIFTTTEQVSVRGRYSSTQEIRVGMQPDEASGLNGITVFDYEVHFEVVEGNVEPRRVLARLDLSAAGYDGPSELSVSDRTTRETASKIALAHCADFRAWCRAMEEQ